MAENQNNQTEQNVNELIKVRREKLAALQEAGNDPFRITDLAVYHGNGTYRAIICQNDSVAVHNFSAGGFDAAFSFV